MHRAHCRFDSIPEHQFQVDEVYEDIVTGTVLTGPLAGEYAGPEMGPSL